MNLPLAQRMSILRASDIREILKVTQQRDVISFAGGLPAPELFPTEALAEIAADVLRHQGQVALQYSPTEGNPRLREQIAGRMRQVWGTTTKPEEVLITTGSQQGLDLTAKVFLDDGDAILCESPSYLGAIMSFTTFRPRWIEIPTDEEGMDLQATEEALRTNRKIKFLYAVPTYQNPSGRTWSLERRKGVVALAQRYGIAVIEDNPYAELWFDAPPPASMQSLDTEGVVMFLGTLSKVFCPGLRLGWIAAPKPMLDKYVVVKQGSDLHSSTFDQLLASVYLDTRDLDADLRMKRDVYRQRRDAMVHALERTMPASVHFTRPAGGLFLWMELPEHLDSRVLLARCLERGVAFVPGEPFFPASGRKNALRLNFSNMPEARIEQGIALLAEETRAMLALAPAAEAAAIS